MTNFLINFLSNFFDKFLTIIFFSNGLAVFVEVLDRFFWWIFWWMECLIFLVTLTVLILWIYNFWQKKRGLHMINKSLGRKWTMANSWCPNFETAFIQKKSNHGDAYNAFSGRCWHINATVFIIVQLLWFGFTSCLYDPWINYICI